MVRWYRPMRRIDACKQTYITPGHAVYKTFTRPWGYDRLTSLARSLHQCHNAAVEEKRKESQREGANDASGKDAR